MSLDKDQEIKALKDTLYEFVKKSILLENGLTSLTNATYELFDNLSIEKTFLNEKAMNTFVSKLNQATKSARESFQA